MPTDTGICGGCRPSQVENESSAVACVLDAAARGRAGGHSWRSTVVIDIEISHLPARLPPRSLRRCDGRCCGSRTGRAIFYQPPD